MQLNCERFDGIHQYGTRKNLDYFILEGNNIDYGLNNDLKMFLYSTEEKDGFKKITEKMMKKMTGNKFVNRVGVALKFNREIISLSQRFDMNKPFIICDNIQDFGNLGSIFRNCFSFGFENVVVLLENMDLYNHKVFESSRGIFFHLKPLCITRQEFLKFYNELPKKFNLFSVDMEGQNCKEINGISGISGSSNNFGLVFGNETYGISLEIRNLCEKNISIKTQFESLNVSVANGIILHQFSQI